MSSPETSVPEFKKESSPTSPNETKPLTPIQLTRRDKKDSKKIEKEKNKISKQEEAAAEKARIQAIEAELERQRKAEEAAGKAPAQSRKKGKK